MNKKVAIVAPSSAYDLNKYEMALIKAHDEGFTVIQHACMSHFVPSFISKSPKEKMAELTAAFACNPDAIWCARGGVGAIDIFGDVADTDFSHTPIIGYSDATILHLARFYKKGRIGIHGPGFLELVKDFPADIERLNNLLEKKTHEINYPELSPILAPTSTLRGPLIVMNLVSLTSLMGMIDPGFFRGKILALEDINEAPYKVFRALRQLFWCGALSGVKALLVGHFNDNREEVVRDVFTPLAQELKIPLFDWPIFGHDPGNLPLLFGAECQIKRTASSAYRLHFLEHFDGTTINL